MQKRINVLSTQCISAEDRAKIEAVDPAIELTDAGGWYDGEIRETWPAFTTARYLVPGATGSGTREERDRLLAEAEAPQAAVCRTCNLARKDWLGPWGNPESF